MNEESIPVQSSGASPPEKKKSQKKKVITIIILIILAIIILLLWRQCGKKTVAPVEENDYAIGAGVKEGAIEEESLDPSAAGSNGTADMTIRINGYPVFEDGESEGDLKIENPIQNVLYMEVEITLNDTGEVIYNSGYIPPNHYIDNDKLDVVLEKGEYNATARVALVDPDDPDTPYNSASFNLVITINN